MRMMIAARLVQRQAIADVSPVRDVALAVPIIAHRDHRSVTLQADCMVISSCDRNNISPAAHIALAMRILAHRDQRSVTLQADCMPSISCDRAVS